jgi:hypothetical protein
MVDQGEMSPQSYVKAIREIRKAMNMMRFPNHVELQAAAFTFINLGQDDVSGKSVAAEQGCIAAVLQAMRMCPNFIKLQTM